MSVRYKFKNDLQFNTLPCDGFDVSLRDLKKAVVRAKKLGRITDFDLVVTNEQTNQTYNNDEDLIPKNSTLIVARHPLPSGQKRVWEEEKLAPTTTISSNSSSIAIPKGTSASSAISGGSFKKHDAEADSATEADKIDAMMNESTNMYASENWQSFRGRGRGSWGRGKPAGPPPITYICASCHQGGHWRADCPLGGKGSGQEIKRTTGIPRSFLTPVAAGTPGAKMTPTGILMGIEMEKNAYEAKKSDKPIWDVEEAEVSLKSANKGVEIPEDLVCPVCKDLLKDAIMMPSCACAMCDECARDSLIESDTNTCPACGEADNSPDDLIPWRQVRDKVNKFKNQSGYDQLSKPTEPLEKPKPVPLGVKPTLPDIYLPDPNDVNFDKMVSNGQILPKVHGDDSIGAQPIASADSPVYGMAGPSPPNYAISPTQQLASSGFGISSNIPSMVRNTELSNTSPIPRQATEMEDQSLKCQGSKIIDNDTPPQSRSRSSSPNGTHSRSPSREKMRRSSGSVLQSPNRRNSTKSPSDTVSSPKSRAVPFPDISQPPPAVQLPPSLAPTGVAIPTAHLQSGIESQATSISSTPQNTSSILPVSAGAAPPGSLPPVIGPPPGTYAVRLPATVPTHLPPYSAQTGSAEHSNHTSLHMPPSAPPMTASYPSGPSHQLPAYNRPPPHHVLHDGPHDHRRGPPPGHGIPPPHMPQRNAYGIDKDGYIDDPLAAFERAMAMKDANKGRVLPPRYDVRGLRRRFSPEPGRRYSSRSPPPRYRDRRSPAYNRRSPTPPQYRERRHSRSPISQRPRIHSKSPDDRGPTRGPKTPPHPHPLRDRSETSPTAETRHESPPPPPGTQSPESKRSPSKRNTPTPEKDGLQNITTTTQQSSSESKDNENSRSPAPIRQRSISSKEKDVRRRSNSLEHPPRDGPDRSPGPIYRRSPPHANHYRYSPSPRHSPPAGYDYNHGPPDQYYRHERHAPPPPDDFYDQRRAREYGHPHREGYGPPRDGGYAPRHNRYPNDGPYYRNDYRDRGRGYGYRGRGRGYGYNQFHPDQRKNYYNDEHNPQHYHRGNPDHESSRRDKEVTRKSRSRERSPTHRNRSAKSPEKDIVAKGSSGNRDGVIENHRKERSHSRERTPSLTPEPEFREQQEKSVRETKEDDRNYAKTEYREAELKNEDEKECDRSDDQFKKQGHKDRDLRDRHDTNEKDKNNKAIERNTSSRQRSRSRSRERGDREREKDKRGSGYRDNKWESSRSRNRDQDSYRSKERRDDELKKERHRVSSVNHERKDRRSPDDRHHPSSRRRDHDSLNKDQRYDKQHRRHEEDNDKRNDRIESRSKGEGRRELSPQEAEYKEKKKKEKKKKKKRDDSVNESEDQSETGAEKKKKKVKKDRKSKTVIEPDELESKTELKSVEGQNDAVTKNENACTEEYEDQVVLHNQETFEDHILNLEKVLETSDNHAPKLTPRSKTENNGGEDSIAKAPDVSKWERSDGDETEKEGQNSSKEDKDLREILKAKSSLTSVAKNSLDIKNVPTDDHEQKLDYDRLIQEKINDQEDSIDVNADSEYDELVRSSEKEEKKVKRRSDKMSDSGSDEKNAKKKKKKERKEKRHKSKDGKKERKKSKKMLKELFGKDTLAELLNKIDEGELPEDVLAKAVLAKTEREISRSPSPRPQQSKERKDQDAKEALYDNSQRTQKEVSSRRAVVSDGKSLKMTIDRNSPRDERPRIGKGESVRRRSRDRSVERRSRRRSRSHSNSRSPDRNYKNDRLNDKREEHLKNTSSRLMEMSMQSSSRLTSDTLEPQKKLSIKDRLGPIRTASSEDRPSSGSSHKSRKQSNEDSYDSGFGRNQLKDSSNNKTGKDERLSSSRNSPSRKEKWSSNDDKYSKRNRDKNPISSECSPPPKKRSRDISESRENSRRGLERSPSPSTKDFSRKSSKDDKQYNKRELASEEKDSISNAINYKRTSARLERNKK